MLFASSRKKAEKKLREQHELLQVTLESIGDAVIATDIDGKINFINQTVEKMTGWTITDAAGSPGEGKGAIFIINLPLANANENIITTGKSAALNPAKATLDPATEAPDLSGLRVLVVDDDPDTLEILQLMLSQYGAEVRTAASVVEALKTFLVWKPAVLVSDIGMPNEDGYSLIGKIRNLSPEQGGNVPAAALTTYVRERDKLQTIAAGFQTHITKPVEQATLAEAVAELVQISEN